MREGGGGGYFPYNVKHVQHFHSGQTGSFTNDIVMLINCDLYDKECIII